MTDGIRNSIIIYSFLGATYHLELTNSAWMIISYNISPPFVACCGIKNSQSALLVGHLDRKEPLEGFLEEYTHIL